MAAYVVRCFGVGLCLFSLPVIFSSCGGAATRKGDFTLDAKPPVLQAGQEYAYQHVGPLPWSGSEVDATGPMKFTVAGRDGEASSGGLWRVEEQYEKADGVQSGFYDDDYRLHRQAVRLDEGEIRVEYEPFMPVRYLDIHTGKSKSYSVRQTLYDASGQALGNAQIELEARRQSDERIITPAGAFLCRHFTTNIQIAATQPDRTVHIRATEDSFWCDRIGWFVQRSYVFDPLVQDDQVVRSGYRTETTLADFNAPY